MFCRLQNNLAPWLSPLLLCSRYLGFSITQKHTKHTPGSVPLTLLFPLECSFFSIYETYFILFCLNAISLARPLTTQCKVSIFLLLYLLTLTYLAVLISHHFGIHMCFFTGLWFFLLLKFKLYRNRDFLFSYCSL